MKSTQSAARLAAVGAGIAATWLLELDAKEVSIVGTIRRGCCQSRSPTSALSKRCCPAPRGSR